MSANPEKVGTAGHPGLAYAFDRIPGKKQSYNHANGNRDARKLFTDNTYVAAHRGKSGATRVLQNGVDPAWAGASVDTVSIPKSVRLSGSLSGPSGQGRGTNAPLGNPYQLSKSVFDRAKLTTLERSGSERPSNSAV